jgi:hypothetical protein
MKHATNACMRRDSPLRIDIPFDAFCAEVFVYKKGNIRFEGDKFFENGACSQLLVLKICLNSKIPLIYTARSISLPG